MKCPGCKSSWNSSASPSVDKCPFCGSTLIMEKPGHGTMEGVLVYIRDVLGEDFLKDGKRLRSIFRDLAPELEREARLLEYLDLCGAIPALWDAVGKSPAQQQIVISRMGHRMSEKTLIPRELAENTCRICLDVICGRNPGEKTPVRQDSDRDFLEELLPEIDFDDLPEDFDDLPEDEYTFGPVDTPAQKRSAVVGEPGKHAPQAERRKRSAQRRKKARLHRMVQILWVLQMVFSSILSSSMDGIFLGALGLGAALGGDALCRSFNKWFGGTLVVLGTLILSYVTCQAFGDIVGVMAAVALLTLEFMSLQKIS